MLPSLCSQSSCFWVLHLSECLCCPLSSPYQASRVSALSCSYPDSQSFNNFCWVYFLCSFPCHLLSSTVTQEFRACYLLRGLLHSCYYLLWLNYFSASSFSHSYQGRNLRSMKVDTAAPPAFGRLKQRDCINFEASLTYRVNTKLIK